MIRSRTLIGLAGGVALALSAGLALQHWRVDAAPGAQESAFVPVEPCRLFDYRPAPDNVGPRATPLGPDETYQQQVTGEVGDCNLPDGIAGVAMNVTVVEGSARSYLTIYPADLVSTPLASNLNWVAGQPPTPNKVDVKLSDGGAVKLYNESGRVYVLADAVGYYSAIDLSEPARAFAVSSFSSVATVLDSDVRGYVSVTVEPPGVGHVTLNSTAYVFHNGAAGDTVACAIARKNAVPPVVHSTTESAQIFEVGGLSNSASLAGTRTFHITARSSVDYVLACEKTGSGTAGIIARNLTAVFTPAP